MCFIFHTAGCYQFMVQCINNHTLNYGRKGFCEMSSQVVKDLEKVQKQGRDENMREDYPMLVYITRRLPTCCIYSRTTCIYPAVEQWWQSKTRRLPYSYTYCIYKKTTLNLTAYTRRLPYMYTCCIYS